MRNLLTTEALSRSWLTEPESRLRLVIQVDDVQIGNWVIAEAEEGETVESQVAFVVELGDEDNIIVLDYHYVRTSDLVELNNGDGAET